jgi:carboxymethylenebutenolidase
MPISEIETQTVNVTSGDVSLPSYLVCPQGDGPWPGIVVIQEIFGVNAHIRDVTERIAREGYVAIAPPIYQRQAPGFKAGYDPDDIKIGREYKVNTKATELLQDIQSAIDFLKQMPQVKAEAIGTIGFCFGGHVAYLAATLPDVKATASFYGAQITTWQPGEDQPTVTRTPEIGGMLYAFFGLEDASIPVEQVDEIEDALAQHNVPHQVFRYAGAGHGFFCDRRQSYEPTAAADAWEQVKQLFRTI